MRVGALNDFQLVSSRSWPVADHPRTGSRRRRQDGLDEGERRGAVRSSSRAVAILHVGGMDDEANNRPSVSRGCERLRPVTFLPASKPCGSASFLRSLGALAVDHRRRWARLAPFPVAYRHIERVVDALERAGPVPWHEDRMCRRPAVRSLGSADFWQPVHGFIEDPVEHLADVHVARPTAAPRRRDHWLDQRPLRIRQIARVTQAAAGGGLPVSGVHIAHPSRMFRVPDNESQTIHPIQQLRSALRGSLLGLKVGVGSAGMVGNVHDRDNLRTCSFIITSTPCRKVTSAIAHPWHPPSNRM